MLTTDIAQKFKELVTLWELEVNGSSFVGEKTNHKAYQQIIEMGDAVIPLILKELETRPNHWFAALRSLTGENPVKPEQRGKIKQMAAAWLQWGKEHGYKW
ncbi:hypothetical protein WA1_46895 [Scytonema hofmannii PCC 7110]|uniref:Uncharacterized protein n=1 Tax=Scytonema hofmannii PCC 7110 TaxID=128403 RepID=A0A139WXQ7_9CYAN|nr:hypothetical protein [Scytonema hofmannii]KYC37162.1 hypothetical protein WA1_46895 [Scytonema hofmannii PCC 7110]